jgi:hypothetical protein
MKRIIENSRKRTGWVKVLGMGLSMAVISWGTPAGADTGPGDASYWFSFRTQPAHQVTAEFQNDGMNILLARGGGGGGRGGGGGGKGGGSGQGKGKGYGAKDGTGTGERPRDGSGYGAGSGQGTKDGSGKGSGSGSGRGNR